MLNDSPSSGNFTENKTGGVNLKTKRDENSKTNNDSCF